MCALLRWKGYEPTTVTFIGDCCDGECAYLYCVRTRIGESDWPYRENFGDAKGPASILLDCRQFKGSPPSGRRLLFMAPVNRLSGARWFKGVRF